MIKNLLSAILIATVFPLQAQFFTYQGTVPVSIPDSNIAVDFPVLVSGLPGQIDSTFGLAEVCLDITHIQVSDLMVSLTSPDGNTIVLSLHNGSGGPDFPGTCFQMNATTTIGSAVAPFWGSFIPDQSLNLLNNGQDPNGTWILRVIDVFPFFSGTFNGWSFTFSNNPPPDPPALQGICNTTNSSGCTCKDTTLNDCDLLPDLTCSYVIIRDGWNEYPGSVDLPNAVINIGSGPVEMRPTGNCFCDTIPVTCSTPLCPDGNAPKERVSQRIYHKNANGVMTYQDFSAGNQSFHSTHNHVHAEDFTEFSLRIATPDPDPINWPVLGKSVKQGYCMINMGSCNTIDSICMSHGQVITNSMLPNYDLGTVTGCGSQGQGIFVGRYDLYGPGFGQSIAVPNLCDGDYYIVTTIDPLNHFREEDETNNSIAVPVHLTQQPGLTLPAGFTYSTSGLMAGFFNYTPGVTRLWNFGDGVSIIDPLPAHQFPAPGTYLIQLTVYDSTCASSSAQYVTVGNIGVGLSAFPSGLNFLEVYPNPASNTFTVSYQLSNPASVRFELISAIGTKIREQHFINRLAGKNEFSITDLKPGSYLVRMTADDKMIQKRIMIIR